MSSSTSPAPASQGIKQSVDKKSTTIDEDGTITVPASSVSENRSWIMRKYDAICSYVPTIQHKLDVRLSPEDAKRVDNLSLSLSTLPEKTNKAVRGLLGDFTDSFFKSPLPESLTQFFFMICDVVVLTLTDNVAIAATLNARMLLQYGFASTAIIDGLAFGIKYFIDYLRRPRDQNGEGKDAPPPAVSQEEVAQRESMLGALYNAIYYYTLGQLPSVTPMNLVKTLIGVNVIFSTARHFEHFGTYFIQILKTVANFIYRTVTGRDWFNPGQRELHAAIIDVTAGLNDLLKIKRPAPHDIQRAMNLIREGQRLHAEALTMDLKKEYTDKFKALLSASANWANLEAGPAEFLHPRAPATIASLRGAPGVGKSMAAEFIISMIKAAEHYAPPVNELIATFKAGPNFQPILPPNAKVLIVNDAFLVNNKESINAVLDEIQAQGDPGPKLREAAAVERKDVQYERIDYALFFDNVVSDNQANVTTVKAIARRFTGGIWTIAIKDAYLTKKGELDKKLLQDMLEQATTWKDIVKVLDSVWTYTSHDGKATTMSGFVNRLVATRHSTLKLSPILSAAAQKLAASFTATEADPIPPPRNLSSAQQRMLDDYQSSDDEYIDDSADAIKEAAKRAYDAPDISTRVRDQSKDLTPEQLEKLMRRFDPFLAAELEANFDIHGPNGATMQVDISQPQPLFSLTKDEIRHDANVEFLQSCNVEYRDDDDYPTLDPIEEEPTHDPLDKICVLAQKFDPIDPIGNRKRLIADLVADLDSSESDTGDDPSSSDEMDVDEDSMERFLTKAHEAYLQYRESDAAKEERVFVIGGREWLDQIPGHIILGEIPDEVEPEDYEDLLDRVFAIPGNPNRTHHQTLTIKSSAAWENATADLRKSERGRMFLKRLETRLQAAAADYVITDTSIPDTVSFLIKKATEMANEEQDDQVLDMTEDPLKWKLPQLKAAEKLTFHAKDNHLRLGDWCYTCKGRNGLCCAFDGDAAEVDNHGLSHYVVRRGKEGEDFSSHFMMDALAYPACTKSRWVVILDAFLIGLASTAATFTIVILLNKVFSMMYAPPKEQSYSAPFAMRAKKDLTATIGHPIHNKPPVHQAGVGPTPPVNDQAFADPKTQESWLDDKITRNTLPVCTVENGESKFAFALMLTENIGATVRHIILHDHIDHFIVGGLVAKRFNTKELSCPEEAQLSERVQYWPIKDRDLIFFILPKSVPPFEDITKYLAPDDTAIGSLTGVYMASWPREQMDLTEKFDPVPKPLPPCVRFPLGDANAYASYISKVNGQGVWINAANPTIDGDCGKATVTTNNRVGRGHARIIGIHSAYDDASRSAITTPLSHDIVMDQINRIPRDARQGVTGSPLPQFQKAGVVSDQSLNVSLPTPHGLLGVLPKNETVHVNTKNSIVRSVLFDALTGVEIYDPVEKKDVLIPAPFKVPAPLKDLKRCHAKFPQNDTLPTAKGLAMMVEAAQRVADKWLSCADPRITRGRSLPTWHEAANGIPELGIPPIDTKKSAGWHRGFPAKGPGKSDYFTRDVNGDLVLIEKWWPIVFEIEKMILNGQVPTVYGVDQPKEELREPEKAARNVTGYWVLVLYVCRRYTMLLGAICMSGRGRNGTCYGANLNGQDGQHMHKKASAFPYHRNADAKNWDANLAALLQTITTEKCADMLQKIQGGDRKWYLACLYLWRVIVHVVGALVWYRYHGGTSGFVLTTPLNSFAMCIALEVDIARFAENNNLPYQEVRHNCYYVVYGDDNKLDTEYEGLNMEHIVETGKMLGITFTDMAKTGEHMPPHSPEWESLLKRRTWVDKSGRVRYILNLQTLAEIHAYVRNRDPDWRASTRLVADAVVRESSLYGKKTFEIVRDSINDKLLINGINSLDYTFSELNNLYLRGNWEDPAGEVPSLTIHDQSATVYSGTGIGATSMEKTQVSSQMEEAKFVTKSINTTHQDATVVSKSTLTPAMHSALTEAPRSPFSSAEMKSVLTREYPLGNVSWDSTGAFTAHLDAATFPDDLLKIPKISKVCEGYRYFTCKGVRVSARVNGTPLAGGAAGFAFVPLARDSTGWQFQDVAILNNEHALVSAAKSDAISKDMEWAAPTLGYDLGAMEPKGAVGTMCAFVAAPLVWASQDHPTNLTITLNAQFIEPDLYGAGVTPAPAETLRSAARNPKVKEGRVKNQALQIVSDALSKSDVLPGGLKDVARTLSTVVEVGETVASFLDKPASQNTVQYTMQRTAPDMITGKGVDYSQPFSLIPAPYMADKNPLVADLNQKPRWKDIFRIPGYLHSFQVNYTNVVDDVLDTWDVQPHLAAHGTADANTYYPSPIAYYSQWHRFWFGDLCYMFYVYQPQFQAFRMRVQYIPDNGISYATGTDKGNVMSFVVDCHGDATAAMEVPWCSNYPILATGPLWSPGAHSAPDSLGRIVVTLEQPLTILSVDTAAPATVLVYVAGGPNFKLIQFKELYPLLNIPAGIASQETLRQAARRTLISQARAVVKEQSWVRADFVGQKFQKFGNARILQNNGVTHTDESDGPIDLMKRYSYALTYDGTFTELAPDILRVGDYWALSAPWRGVSGMKNWMAWMKQNGQSFGKQAPYSGNFMWVDQQSGQWWAENFSNAAGGMIFADLDKETFLRFATPYCSCLAFQVNDESYDATLGGVVEYNIYGIHVNGPIAIDGSTYKIDIYISAGDDTNLYHFSQCPRLNHPVAFTRPKVLTQTELKGKGAERLLSLTPTSSSMVEDSYRPHD